MPDYEVKATGVVRGCNNALLDSLTAMRRDSVKLTAFVIVGLNPDNAVVTATSVPVGFNDEQIEQLIDLVIESLNSYKGRQ